MVAQGRQPLYLDHRLLMLAVVVVHITHQLLNQQAERVVAAMEPRVQALLADRRVQLTLAEVVAVEDTQVAKLGMLAAQA